MTAQNKTRKQTQDAQTLNSTVYIASFVISSVVLLAATWFALAHRFYGWEIQAFLEINSWPSHWQNVFKGLSQLGLWAGVLLVVAGTFLRKWQFTWRLSATLLVGYGLVVALKHIVSRGRPDEYLQNIHVYWMEYGAGFPSAHAALATVAMLSLYPILPKLWWWVMAPLFIALVCISRFYLGAHVPLDAIGGVAVGAMVVCGSYLLPAPIARILRLKNGRSNGV